MWPTLIGAVVARRDVVLAVTLLLTLGALHVAPFDLPLPEAVRAPLNVDAIPNLGDNQQVVVAEWPGRSPRDVDDQITYPLSAALMSVAGVETVRASSMMGLSTLYVIFEDDVDFYWARSRVLERLASLPNDALPPGVAPSLGPDATALGQVFWYTLEGRDADGNTVGGWDLDELRSIQDWTVRFALQAVDGVSEVASVGGYVREYQVDVDPDALRARDVTLDEVAAAVRESNLDVGARTLEINRVEYLVRGLGFIESLEDLELSVVGARDATPIRLKDIGRVSLGPALRRGALDDGGAPTVGGVVVARFGANPREVIEAVRQKIDEISTGLPSRTSNDGTKSRVTIVPFYDRTELIEETLGTLSSALLQQLVISVIVVFFFLRGVGPSSVVSLMLPLGVGATFIAMKLVGVEANIMALGGIAIAIGTMVDVGVVFVENIRQHLADADAEGSGWMDATRDGAAEVAPAVATSVVTTVVSFLPVFGLTDSDLRLFGPLAATKTLAMVCALLLGILVVPVLASLFVRPERKGRRDLEWPDAVVVGLGITLLALLWSPLGDSHSRIANALFIAVVVIAALAGLFAFRKGYAAMLTAVLEHRPWLLGGAVAVVLAGAVTLPGFGQEHLPPFDEGAFLYMPTTMPHASIGQALEVLSGTDAAIAAVPEVDRVVGKIGRVDSALDPAPISMLETVITYVPEYGVDESGARVRQWRDHIRSPDDIWEEIVQAAQWPGLTSAPKLMPIQARLVMLQSGMRAPMGIKVRGPDLETLQEFGVALEGVLEGVNELRAETVFADRVVGKPYLEVDVDRRAAGRYGLTVAAVQKHIEVALGGVPLTRTVEGRERYDVRVRYQREERDSIEAIGRLSVSVPRGGSVPLAQLAEIRFSRGPQMIRSEDTFLTSYVIFDRKAGVSEVEGVEAAQAAIRDAINEGVLEVPPGVSYTMAGSYREQVESQARLVILVPLALILVFVVLQWQFRSLALSLIIYSAVMVSISGGLLLLWLYSQPWMGELAPLGVDLASVFQIQPVQLSVAVWVGFIALVGLATDDAVVLMTYLRQRFAERRFSSPQEVRAAVLEASGRRLRPCLMTTGTTLLALLPLITSNGRGADLMLPIALPLFGGMLIELMTLFVVPALFSLREERRLGELR